MNKIKKIKEVLDFLLGEYCFWELRRADSIDELVKMFVENIQIYEQMYLILDGVREEIKLREQRDKERFAMFIQRKGR